MEISIVITGESNECEDFLEKTLGPNWPDDSEEFSMTPNNDGTQTYRVTMID